MATGVACHDQAIGPGEPEIGHHQVRPLSVDQRDRVRPRVGPKGLVPCALEKPLTVRDEIRLVIDDQDGPFQDVMQTKLVTVTPRRRSPKRFA
jgi:hypothetical protein